MIKKIYGSNPSFNFEFLFVYLGIFYLINFFLSASLVTFSIYNKIPFIMLMILCFGGIIYLFLTKKFIIDFKDILAFIIIIFFGIFSFVFFHHTLYGTRDDGVYANAAIGIIERGSIYIKSFINFPGWTPYHNMYIPQFLFGTISWIALNFSFFGINGVYFTNVIPIIIGGLSFYYIAKPYIKNYSFYLLFCFFLSYPMIWFTRRTISEIIFFSLLWFSFYLMREIIVNKKYIYSLLLLLCCNSYILVRGEGMIYMFFTILILMYIYIKLRKRKIIYGLFGLIFLIPFLFYSIFVSNDYIHQLQKFIEKILAKVFPFYFNAQIVDKASSQILHTSGSLYYNILPYILAVFAQYNLLFFICSVFICLILLFFKDKSNVKNIFLITLIVINLPTFYSLFDFTIAPDQPWFLRRYLFSIIPLGYFCGFLLICKIKNEILKNIILITLIVFNIIISAPILFFSEYKEMRGNIDNLANNFTSRDMVFVDQYATGWYRMATELYFRKEVNAYYISPNSPKNKSLYTNSRNLDFDQYKNVYVITNKKFKSEYSLDISALKQIKYFPISYSTLMPTSDLLHLDTIPNYNILNLNFNDIKSLIQIPQNIYLVKNDIVIYKISSKSDFYIIYKYLN